MGEKMPWSSLSNFLGTKSLGVKEISFKKYGIYIFLLILVIIAS
jgi:hypothetical protein